MMQLGFETARGCYVVGSGVGPSRCTIKKIRKSDDFGKTKIRGRKNHDEMIPLKEAQEEEWWTGSGPRPWGTLVGVPARAGSLTRWAKWNVKLQVVNIFWQK